jgi:hypothetical protein
MGCRAATVLWLLAGCYNPHIPNRGFRCDPAQVDACPDGFRCVDGRCDNGLDVTLPPPAAADLGGDLAGPTAPADLGAGDLSTSPGSDLSTPPSADLASPPQCLPPGGYCSYPNHDVCCSRYCYYSTHQCR